MPSACSRAWSASPAEDRASLVGLIFQLLAGAVREGALDSRTTVVAELGQLLTDKGIDARIALQRRRT